MRQQDRSQIGVFREFDLQSVQRPRTTLSISYKKAASDSLQLIARERQDVTPTKIYNDARQESRSKTGPRQIAPHHQVGTCLSHRLLGDMMHCKPNQGSSHG